MLETRQQHSARSAVTREVVADLHDRRDGIARLPEEFQADRARVRGHAMQDPPRRRDDAVAAFLLYAGQSAEQLVGDVLAETELAKGSTRNLEPLLAQHARRVGRLSTIPGHDLEDGQLHVVNLAAVMAEPCHFDPVAIRAHHAPPREVVERGAPQHGFLAARVHGDVATHA